MNSEASPPAETTEELSRLKQRIRELERAEVEHRRTEEALRQSEERYRTFFEQAAVGVAEIEHVTGRFLTANQRLCELLGRTEQELQATTFQAITHPEDLHLHEEKSEQLLAGAIDHYALEKRYLAKNGAPVWVNITVSHPHGMDFPCRRNIVVVEDITERKQAEEALLAQGNKMASIFRAAPVGIGTVIHRVLQEANDMLCLMTGYSREELVGQSARMLYPTQEDYDYVGKEKYRQIGEKSTGTVETRWLRKDGAVIDILLSSTPLVPQDLARGVTFTALDITDRKRAERELLEMQNKLHHAQKLESLGTLAGGVAHDFNNLLMGIQGYASLALLDQDPTHPNYERLKRIEEQVKSGADLTRQLLGFARGGRYEVVPTDMNDILDKTASLFCRTKKEISLLRKYAADLRPVDVDRGQMEQVLLNLYVNAWQAMPQGGEIYLETANVLLDDGQASLHAVEPGPYVKLSVTDTGMGMDEKTRERIFDPFFTTKALGRGTGLGLATVYGIVKGHRGLITVYSEPGHGSTFNIYLPASEREVVRNATAAGTIARGTETILLVDDEKMVLEVSREMLLSLGYRVYAAGSGQEALAVCLEKKDAIHLVLLDMIMPGISGGETFDRLRDIHPGIRVLLSSGYSINGEAVKIMDRGCNGFLQKPFELAKLSKKIREILDA